MAALLKEEISQKKLEELAKLLGQQDEKFEPAVFINTVMDHEWEELSLMQRVRHVSEAFYVHLSGDYSTQLLCLLNVHHHFSGIFHFVFSDFVKHHGLNDFDLSMKALEAFTENSTGEFAIRVYIQKDPERVKGYLCNWVESDNAHLRRLASEGVRPRLPWAQRIDWIADDPDWVLPIIQSLRGDPSRYVQKSVANLLNDLSKHNAPWVLKLCKGWDLTNPQTKWIVKHALRTLLKQGNTKALTLLGYPSADHVHLTNWVMPKQVSIGKTLSWAFDLHSANKLGLIRLEYALYFLRQKQPPYRKVFKISEGEVETNTKSVSFRHNFKPISTRVYVAGVHKLELILNGSVIKSVEFHLLD